MSQLPNPRARVSPRLVLGLVLFAFLLPVGFAAWVYQRSDHFALSQHAHGTILRPSPQISPLAYTAPDHPMGTATDWHGHWYLVYVAPEICNAACIETIAAIDQVPPALGKHTSRVRTLFISTTPPPSTLPAHWTVAQIQPSDQLYYFFAYAAKTSIQTAGAVFILDPQGFLVMYYPVPLDTQGLFRDTQRLMRLSST